MYALIAFGTAALMIFFIATIVAGIIVGTVLAVMDLVHHVRGASLAGASAEQEPAETLA